MSDSIWVKPSSLDVIRTSEFPLDALPKVMREAALQRAGELNCDPSLVIGAMLTVTGAACGAANIRLNKGEAWVEPGPVWSITVADPGSRKSAALGSMIGALNLAQKQAIEEDRQTRPGKNLRVRRAERAIKHAEKQYDELLDKAEETGAEIDQKDIDAIEAQVNQAHTALAEVKAKVGMPPLLNGGSFATPEKLHDMLAEYKNLMMYVPEGDTFFRKIVGEKLDRDIFLQSWSMEDAKRNLVGRDAPIAEHPSLHFGINVQVEIILDVLRNGGDVLSKVGLFDRFLWFLPDTSQLQETVFHDLSDPDLFKEVAIKAPELLAYYGVIQREVRRTLELRGEPTSWVLDDGAAEVQSREYEMWASYMHNYSSLSSKGVLAKLAGQAIRLARIFAQVEMDDPGMDPFGGNVTPLNVKDTYAIPPWAVTMGWTVAWFCFRNHEYLFGDAMSADVEKGEFARNVLKKIRQLADEGEWSFKVRTLQRKGLMGHKASELNAILDGLTRGGWLHAVPGDRAGTVVYTTHPEIVRWIEEYGL